MISGGIPDIVYSQTRDVSRPVLAQFASIIDANCAEAYVWTHREAQGRPCQLKEKIVKSHADTTNTTAGDTRCLVCAAHPGWAHADESRRDSQRDCCAACLGSGTRQVFTVATYPEAARIAGHMAGKLGGVWTRNNAGTTIIVAANTSPYGLSRANRWATVKVTKGGNQ